MKRMKIHTKSRGKTNLCNAFIVVFVIHNRSISDSEFSKYTRLNQSGCLISLSNDHYVSIYVRVIGIIRTKFQYFPRQIHPNNICNNRPLFEYMCTCNWFSIAPIKQFLRPAFHCIHILLQKMFQKANIQSTLVVITSLTLIHFHLQTYDLFDQHIRFI